MKMASRKSYHNHSRNVNSLATLRV